MAFYIPRNALIAVAIAALTLLFAFTATAAEAAPAPDKQLAAWIKKVTAKKPAVKVRGYKSKFTIPAKLRRATPALTRKAVALAKRAAAVSPKSFRGKRRLPLAGIAATGPIVAELEIPGGRQVVDGVELSASATLKKYDDGTVESQFKIEAKKDGYTVRLTPLIDLNDKGLPEIGCPTADGKLAFKDTAVEGGTAMVLKGRKVIAARTERVTTTTVAEGQVGRDARLASVSASLTRRVENYERGLQVVTDIKRQYSVPREGDPVGGVPQVAVKIKAAQVPRSAVAAAEKSYAQQHAEGTSSDMAPRADLARWKMVQDEYKWYQLPNYCAQATLDPNGVQLQEGQSKAVSGVVTANDGGVSPGEFTVSAVGRGSFVATKGAHDPGSPAEFAATAAKPDGSGTTVQADVIATSMGGRAQATFNAQGVDVKVPTSFGGWVESTTEGGGLKYHFDALLNFERTYVNTGPNGFATAWYELTSISAEHESYNEIGSGCRWVAKAPSGNTINSGDVELRRASAGAPWTYAIQVDLSVLNQTFKSTDCPPGAELPTFTGDIVNQLYTAPNNNFREIWDGSTENDMRLIQMSPVSDVRGPGELPTTANWGLIGSWD